MKVVPIQDFYSNDKDTDLLIDVISPFWFYFSLLIVSFFCISRYNSMWVSYYEEINGRSRIKLPKNIKMPKIIIDFVLSNLGQYEQKVSLSYSFCETLDSRTQTAYNESIIFKYLTRDEEIMVNQTGINRKVVFYPYKNRKSTRVVSIDKETVSGLDSILARLELDADLSTMEFIIFDWSTKAEQLPAFMMFGNIGLFSMVAFVISSTWSSFYISEQQKFFTFIMYIVLFVASIPLTYVYPDISIIQTIQYHSTMIMNTLNKLLVALLIIQANYRLQSKIIVISIYTFYLFEIIIDLIMEKSGLISYLWLSGTAFLFIISICQSTMGFRRLFICGFLIILMSFDLIPKNEFFSNNYSINKTLTQNIVLICYIFIIFSKQNSQDLRRQHSFQLNNDDL